MQKKALVHTCLRYTSRNIWPKNNEMEDTNMKKSCPRAASHVGFTLMLGAMATTALAQTPPGAVPVGPMFAYPELELAIKRDTNIALSPDTSTSAAISTRKADTIWYVRPGLRLEAKQGENAFNVAYRGEYGRYDSQTNFNFNNHDFSATGDLTLDERNKLRVGLQYVDRVDPPGTLNIVQTPTPNKYHQPMVSGFYTYGAQDAQGKLELSGSYLDKKYVNNRFATFGLDHTEADYGGTLLWRLQPKTYATFNLRQTKYNYADPTITLDSTNTFALIGVRWEATAATSGRFAIGSLNKKFDDAGHAAGRQDFTGTSWEGNITWKPVEYSGVDFNTQRKTNDSTGLGNYMINQTHQISWNHALTSRVSSKLMGSYSNDKFINAPVAAAGNTDRKDDTYNAGLRLTYEMRRWLKLGADYLYTKRNSNDDNFDYKRNQIMFFVSGTL